MNVVEVALHPVPMAASGSCVEELTQRQAATRGFWLALICCFESSCFSASLIFSYCSKVRSLKRSSTCSELV